MNETLCSIDWIKVAKVVQALATPAIAIWIAAPLVAVSTSGHS
jgi:hypothetical protein